MIRFDDSSTTSPATPPATPLPKIWGVATPNPIRIDAYAYIINSSYLHVFTYSTPTFLGQTTYWIDQILHLYIGLILYIIDVDYNVLYRRVGLLCSLEDIGLRSTTL